MGSDTSNSSARSLLTPRTVIAAVLVALAVIFILQNRAETTIQLFWASVQSPLWLTLVVLLLLAGSPACSPPDARQPTTKPHNGYEAPAHRRTGAEPSHTSIYGLAESAESTGHRGVDHRDLRQLLRARPHTLRRRDASISPAVVTAAVSRRSRACRVYPDNGVSATAPTAVPARYGVDKDRGLRALQL